MTRQPTCGQGHPGPHHEHVRCTETAGHTSSHRTFADPNNTCYTWNPGIPANLIPATIIRPSTHGQIQLYQAEHHGLITHHAHTGKPDLDTVYAIYRQHPTANSLALVTADGTELAITAEWNGRHTPGDDPSDPATRETPNASERPNAGQEKATDGDALEDLRVTYSIDTDTIYVYDPVCSWWEEFERSGGEIDTAQLPADTGPLWEGQAAYNDRARAETAEAKLARQGSNFHQLRADFAETAGRLQGAHVDLIAAERERDDARSKLAEAEAKLQMPCGSCHPCVNWSDETWRRENKKPPHFHEWQELRAERDADRAKLDAITDHAGSFHAAMLGPAACNPDSVRVRAVKTLDGIRDVLTDQGVERTATEADRG